MNWTEKSQTERLPPSLSYTQTPSCVTLSSSLPAPSLPLFTSLPLPFFFQFFTAHQRLWMVDNSSYFVPLASITPVRVWGGWAERTATVSDPQMSCKVTGRTVEIFIWEDDDCALKALKYARFFFFLFIGFHVRAKVAMAHFTHYR